MLHKGNSFDILATEGWTPVLGRGNALFSACSQTVKIHIMFVDMLLWTLAGAVSGVGAVETVGDKPDAKRIHAFKCTFPLCH